MKDHREDNSYKDEIVKTDKEEQRKNKKKNKKSNQISWIKRSTKIKIQDPIVSRGEDTTTYGEATSWLQPGTPKGDRYLEIMGIKNRSDNNGSSSFSGNPSSKSKGSKSGGRFRLPRN